MWITCFQILFRPPYVTECFYFPFYDVIFVVSEDTETIETDDHQEEKSSVQDSQEQSHEATLKETSTPNPQLSLAEERARKFEKIKHNLANPLTLGKDKKSVKKEEKKKEEKSVWQNNGPRKQSEITVSFTPRYFPSAARESTAADEEAVS